MAHCNRRERAREACLPSPRRPHSGRERGSSLVEVLAAIAITAAVMAAAAGIFQRVSAAMLSSASRNRQVKALFYAATEARRSGAASPVIEGYPVSSSRRAAVWGTDAVLVRRTPNGSCQGDCNPDVEAVVSSSYVFTVTVGTVNPQERAVSLLGFTAAQ